LYVAASLAYAAKIMTAKAPTYAQGGLIRVSKGETYFSEEDTQKLLPQLIALNETQRIDGPGTETSDSIMAVADGGFVLNARASKRLNGFAVGGDVLNRDFAYESPPVAATAQDNQVLADKMDRLSRTLLYTLRNMPPNKAVIERRETAAIKAAGEYQVSQGTLWTNS